MSVVLQWVPRKYKQATQESANLSAEIIIFPGVRFERKNFDAPIKNRPLRKRRNSALIREEDSA